MTVVAVIGLGYVGLPLAVEFGRHFPTIGFDIAPERVRQCQDGTDPSRELSSAQMAAARHTVYTADAAQLAQADIIIVAVPTPVDSAHIPDLGALTSAATSAGRHMKRGAIVVFESTVYPGATEEVCIPVLERVSGLRWKQDFFVGYSPERINPGDKEHTLTSILKIVAADTPATLDTLARLYETIVRPGVHRAPSIKAAEAAKVIENTQRDLNISLMNELAIIFERLGLDTGDVLAAAATKWNFLNFKPGLVGGHCIGVDPYYLTHKAEMVGYNPQVILAGRRINDGMGKFIAEQTIKRMVASGSAIRGAAVNVMGLTFKEDCADLRNSRVVDIIRELQSYGVTVYVADPLADPEQALANYGVVLLPWSDLPRADALVAAVAHHQYTAMTVAELGRKLVPGGAFIDVKSAFDRRAIQQAGYTLWRL
jgi:UDP-N-acetyl-D-glucosamine/UDP-N-acetyl-D-galactosamine dehydrogenase